MDAGRVCGVQVSPPVVVPSTIASFEVFSPAASHTVTEAQAMVETESPEGTVWAVQIAPLSVVLMMLPPLAASHTEVDGQTTIPS